MKNPYITSFVLFVFLFLIIYNLKLQPSRNLSFEKSRIQNIQATGIQNIIKDARLHLSLEQNTMIDLMTSKMQNIQDDSSHISLLKEVAKIWFDNGYPIISGYYAEKVAQLVNIDDAYAIAGTTYLIGMRNAKLEKNRSFSKSKAVQNLEKAISLNPEELANHINLALLYVEAPDKNPMQGILMLRELNEKHPNNVPILNHLGRLCIKTNQWEKAKLRLHRSYSLDSTNINTNCLLAQLYTKLVENKKAEKYLKLCKI